MILFLDFDGVLHPADPLASALFCRRHLLWRLLDERPEIEVVFSTSWRDLHPVDALISFVTAGGGEYLAGRFLGATPVRVVEPGAAVGQVYKRETEIRLWLSGNGEQSRNWIAVDDFSAYFSPGCANLVLIEDYEQGMTESDLLRLRDRCAALTVSGGADCR